MKNLEPIKLRWKRLDNGKESAFLDITLPNRPRQKEYLRLYRGGDINRHDSREAERLAAAICAKRLADYNALRAGAEIEKSYLLKDYTEDFSSERTEHYQKLTNNVRRRLLNYLSSTGVDLDSLLVSDVTTEMIDGFKASMQKSKTTAVNRAGEYVETSKPMKSDTINTYLQVVKRFFNKAVEDGLINRSPVVGVSKLKSTKGNVNYLTIEEVKKLIDTPFEEQESLRRAFLFSCVTGIRISDIRQLTWKNIKQIGDNSYSVEFVQRKTAGATTIIFDDFAYQFLPAEHNGGVLFSSIPTHYNGPLTRWLKSAGIDRHISYHCSRHTAAVSLLTAGAGIYTVSRILGHSSINTTQIYADIIDKTKAEAMSNLSKLYQNGGQLGDKNSNKTGRKRQK